MPLSPTLGCFKPVAKPLFASIYSYALIVMRRQRLACRTLTARPTIGVCLTQQHPGLFSFYVHYHTHVFTIVTVSGLPSLRHTIGTLPSYHKPLASAAIQRLHCADLRLFRRTKSVLALEQLSGCKIKTSEQAKVYLEALPAPTRLHSGNDKDLIACSSWRRGKILDPDDCVYSQDWELNHPHRPMGSSAEPGFGEDLQNQINLRHNLGVATFVWQTYDSRRIFGSLLAGLVAGILGVTGWIGFSYYFVVNILVAALLWRKTGGDIENYFPSKLNLLVGELFSSTTLLTFILFWTLANNFIHLF